MMFLLKWVLSVIVLGMEAMKETLILAAVRVNGTVYMGETNLDPEATLGQRLLGAIYHNEGMLFPFRMKIDFGTGALLFTVLAFMCLIIIYLLRDGKFSGRTTGSLLLLGCVPYVRYLVLNSHSFQHYFFTYRAQLVSIMALFYLTWEYGLKNVLLKKK